MKGLNKLNLFWYLWKRNNWLFSPRLWFARFENVIIDRPIFLLGVQGGGLTLVSRMLRRHQQIISVSGNHEYWSGADEMHTVLGPLLPAELTGMVYKVPFSDHPILEPPRSWTYACDEMLPFYRKTYKEANWQIKVQFERVIRMCIARHADGRQRTRFIDKSQVYTVRVSLLRELLKEYKPKFVLITNNPYAACYRAALGKAQDMERLKGKLPFQERLKICAQHWANTMRCAMNDWDEDMIAVCFEDILQDPEGGLRRICKHVELDFSQDMLPASHHKIPFGSRFRDRWYPLRPERALHFIKQATQEEIQIVTDRCGQLAGEFGYEVPTYATTEE